MAYWDDEYEAEPRAGVNWLRYAVTLLSMGVAYLAAFATLNDGLPAWIGGLLVVGAAGLCYAVERKGI